MSETARRNTLQAYADAHADGLTNYEIADRLGVSYHVVRASLSKLGLKANPLHRAAFDETRALHAEGLTTVEIAERTGATHSTISYRLRAMGLRANAPKRDDEAGEASRRARIERASEARRQSKAMERAKLMRTAFMHDTCPVPEEMLGQVMARMIGAQPARY